MENDVQRSETSLKFSMLSCSYVGYIFCIASHFSFTAQQLQYRHKYQFNKLHSPYSSRYLLSFLRLRYPLLCLYSPFKIRALSPNLVHSLSSPPQFRRQGMDVWTCCQCRAANLLAIAPSCPICCHGRCSSGCRIGPPPQQLGSPGPQFPSQHHRSGHSYYTFSSPSNQSEYRLSSPPSYTPPSAPPRHASIVTTANTRRPPSARGRSHGSYNSVQGSQSALQQRLRQAPGGSNCRNMFAPPSMAGWWRCCQDEIDNDPALCPERCVLDGHEKCGGCYNY